MTGFVNECRPGAIDGWLQSQKEHEAITAERERARLASRIAAQAESQAIEDKQREVRTLKDAYMTRLFAVPRRSWSDEHKELFADLQAAMERFENRRAPQ